LSKSDFVAGANVSALAGRVGAARQANFRLRRKKDDQE
jgi:hypothetical protein